MLLLLHVHQTHGYVEACPNHSGMSKFWQIAQECIGMSFSPWLEQHPIASFFSEKHGGIVVALLQQWHDHDACCGPVHAANWMRV